MTNQIGSKFEVHSPSSKTGMGYLVPHEDPPSMPSRRRAGSLSSSDDQLNDNYHEINSDEESFTFSSVADLMDFNFSSTACFAQAEAMKGGPLCMSPADELFEDGKIRPLMQPIDGRDRALHLTHAFSIKLMLNQPLIGTSHLNYGSRADELLISPHNDVPNHSFQAKKLTDQSIISTHHGEINQGSRPESADHSRIRIHDGELNHGMSAKPIDQMVLGSDLNHRLRANVKDQIGIRNQEGDLNYGGLPLDYVSLSSPASPVCGIKANDGINYNKEDAINNSFAVISTNHYKRSCSLSRFRRVFQIEDHEQIIEMQSEDVIKGGLQFEARSKQRRTLKDLLIQEENAMIKLTQARMIKKKKKKPLQEVGLETQSRVLSDEESVINSLNLVRRQSLAPAPINIPKVWPIRDELLSPPRNSDASGACPYERHYATQRAQAERMKKKTFLPYRPGLLACLLMRSPSLAQN